MSTVQGPRSTRSGDRWRVVWREPGSRRQEVVGGFTSREGAEKWRALLDAVGSARARSLLGQPDAAVDVRSFAEQVAHHIDHLTGVTDGTKRRNYGYLRRRIANDPLGKVPLSLVTRDDITAWVRRMEHATDPRTGKPLSAKTIENHHSLISAALTSAVRAGLVTTNHAEGIRIGTPDVDDSEEMVTLTLEEVFQFVRATPEHWRPMVLFMFGTGCRWQEAAALQVGDVDLRARRVRIEPNNAWWNITEGARLDPEVSR